MILSAVCVLSSSKQTGRMLWVGRASSSPALAQLGLGHLPELLLARARHKVQVNELIFENFHHRDLFQSLAVSTYSISRKCLTVLLSSIRVEQDAVLKLPNYVIPTRYHFRNLQDLELEDFVLPSQYHSVFVRLSLVLLLRYNPSSELLKWMLHVSKREWCDVGTKRMTLQQSVEGFDNTRSR